MWLSTIKGWRKRAGLIVIAIAVTAVPSWYVMKKVTTRIVDGGAWIQVKIDRQARLQRLWSYIDSYRSRVGRYPTSHNDLVTMFPQVERDLSPPKAPRSYEVRYGRLGTASRSLVVADPGYTGNDREIGERILPNGLYADGRLGLFSDGTIAPYGPNEERGDNRQAP